jgi:RNase P subunit RPR2
MNDQSVESRTAFVASHFSTCVKCGSEDLKETKKTEGIRHNGDAYGYTVFACTLCSWSTRFEWDEDAEVYYYEVPRLLKKEAIFHKSS